MTLTKTGAGTQILTGANTYTGATIVNGGTLTVGGDGSLSSSSALQISGGIFSYGNTAAGQTVNGLAVGAGNSTVNNTAAGQTLTLGAITRTASIFGTVNFATLTGPISTTTGNTNGIIGPWATTGSTTTLRYAVGSPDGSTPTNISAFTTGTTATANTLANVTDATVNYEYSAAVATICQHRFDSQHPALLGCCHNDRHRRHQHPHAQRPDECGHRQPLTHLRRPNPPAASSSARPANWSSPRTPRPRPFPR